MMKVLALNGSPRRKGNTDELLRAIVKGMETAGGEVEVVRLVELNIKGCIGCGGCDKTGHCVLEDDMQQLYPKILEVKRIVLASPIYFYGITSQAKAFVDRNQALWNRKRIMVEKGEWQNEPERKGFLVCVAATQGIKLFDGPILNATYVYDAMGMKYGGEFLVKGKDRRGDMVKDKEILQKAFEAGKKFME